jgi:Fic family protein
MQSWWETYYNLLVELGLADYIDNLAANSEKDKLMQDTIVKTIFYSSKIEGNKLGEEAATLLINSDFVERGSILEDYLELLNHKELYRLIYSLKDRSITNDDIINAQMALFNNIIGMPTGIRNGPGSVGGHILKTDKDYYNELNYSVEILNRVTNSKCEALLNAIEFHLKFVSLHPFEDGNGRMSRLFVNFYLLKNGMLPLLISASEKAPYFNSLAISHFTDNHEFFTAMMISFYLRDKLGELSEQIRERKKHLNDEHLAFADTLLLYTNKIDKTELQYDISKLLESNDNAAKAGALWLTLYADLKDYNIPLTLLKSSDPNLKALALLVLDHMLDNNFDEYSKIFEDAATKENAKNVRMVALNVIGYRSKSSLYNLAYDLIEEGDDDIIIQLLNILHYKPIHKDTLPLIRKLIDSNLRDIKIKAYQAFLINVDEKEVVWALDKLYTEEHELLEPVLYRFIRDLSEGKDKSKGNRLNLDIISHKLVEIASRDKQVRNFLIRFVSHLDFINSNYIVLAENILKDDNSTDAEKGYSLHILSKFKTYEDIKLLYGVDFDAKDSLVKNIALALSYLNGAPEIAGFKQIFDIKNAQLNEVLAIEIARNIEQNKFGKDFLLLWKKN